jgi:hypothetical protein
METQITIGWCFDRKNNRSVEYGLPVVLANRCNVDAFHYCNERNVVRTHDVEVIEDIIRAEKSQLCAVPCAMETQFVHTPAVAHMD